MALLQSISNKLTDILRSPTATTYSPASLEKYDNSEELKRAAHFERLYNYYINDERKIADYTRRAMGGLFKDETIVKMRFVYFNIVRRIINRLSLSYKNPPERYIVVASNTETDQQGKIQSVLDPITEKANENYQLLLEGSNINCQSKLWENLAKLMDTVYVMPVWRKDHIDFDVLPIHRVTVVENPDNYLEPIEFTYKVIGEKGEDNYIYWSETEHRVLDSQKRMIPGKNDTNGKNPYGILPVVVLRLKETENHFGEGDTQLVNMNEKINVLLMSGYYNAIMQAHGQLVGINTDLKGDVSIGPDRVIQVKNVSGDQQASLQYIHPDPAIEPVMKKIDWLIRVTAMMKGLPSSSVSIDVPRMSGASKEIDNYELLESRTDDLEYLRPFEKKLFEVCRVIWNYHNLGDKQIPENMTFGIDFEEPKAPTSELDDLKAKEIKLAFGTWTPIEDMIDEDEGIDRETALNMLRENLQIRNELNDEYGLGDLKLLDTQQQPDISMGIDKMNADKNMKDMNANAGKV